MALRVVYIQDSEKATAARLVVLPGSVFHYLIIARA
jgi:hypothetical protein